MRFLVGAPIISVHARRMGDTDAEAVHEDKASITLGLRMDRSALFITFLMVAYPLPKKE